MPLISFTLHAETASDQVTITGAAGSKALEGGSAASKAVINMNRGALEVKQ